ncbi:hypothetical protein [Nannocystis pusilla]|uniref:hypothetical protein n=1 Tax=Nannocystis pusilla TaxID=889268 RepID=UPI003B8196BE
MTLGCGPDGHGESSSEASDVGGTSTGGASSSTTTASEPTSASTSSSTTEEPEPEPEPAPACGPPPEGAALDITIDGEVPFTLGDVRFDQACEVAEVEDDGAGVTRSASPAPTRWASRSSIRWR